MSSPALTREIRPAARAARTTGAHRLARAAHAGALDGSRPRRTAVYGFSPDGLRSRYDKATEEAV